jgi:hypothetical protein
VSGVAALAPVRTGRYRESAVVLAAAAGLAVTTVHWGGLVLGGTLLGLVAPSLPRALATAASFGLLVVVAFAAWLLLGGSLAALATWPTTGPLFVVAVGAAVGLPALAALLVRALV